MKWLIRLAALYLIAVLFMAWGFAAATYQIFPYELVREVVSFVQGSGEGPERSLGDKLMNDAGLVPRRFLYKPDRAILDGTAPMDLDGLKSRRTTPQSYLDPAHASGYRVIVGALDFEESFWGALLLGPDGEALHRWHLTTEHLPGNDRGTAKKVLYGAELFPDGSLIFTLQEAGGGIVKVDACSEVVWNLNGRFHHTISKTDDGHFWTFLGGQGDWKQTMALVSVDTGKIVRQFNMFDIERENPYVHLFDLQKDPKQYDPLHGNDIDPLPASLASRFPSFAPGDILLSFRTPSLLMVVDPETLEIKWWRVGAAGQQHDPDWEEDGRIAVYGNNTRSLRIHSDIVAIEPANHASEVVLDGSDYGFYSLFNGDHQATAFGTRMVTSATQGWVFEVDEAGDIVFSFVNSYDLDTPRTLHVGEASRLPEDYFTEDFWNRCPQG